MIYLVIINVLGFLIMGLDKAKAKKQKYRISENTLLFVALMGGYKILDKNFVYAIIQMY